LGPTSLVSGPSSLVSDLQWPSNKEESTGPVSCHGPPVGESHGPYDTPVQPTETENSRLVPMASTPRARPCRLMFPTLHKLLSRKVTPCWAIGVHATAPVPWLIVVWAILWVINPLHDPGSPCSNQLPPVPSALPPTEIGEPLYPTHYSLWK